MLGQSTSVPVQKKLMTVRRAEDQASLSITDCLVFMNISIVPAEL